MFALVSAGKRELNYKRERERGEGGRDHVTLKFKKDTVAELQRGISTQQREIGHYEGFFTEQCGGVGDASPWHEALALPAT